MADDRYPPLPKPARFQTEELGEVSASAALSPPRDRRRADVRRIATVVTWLHLALALSVCGWNAVRWSYAVGRSADDERWGRRVEDEELIAASLAAIATRAQFSDDFPKERARRAAAELSAAERQKSPLVQQAVLSRTARHEVAVEFYLSAIWAAAALSIILVPLRP